MTHETHQGLGLPPRKVKAVAEELGLDTEKILPHGHYIAKVPLEEYESRKKLPDGDLILVTAMTPTPQGEGKTTTTIGLGDALRLIGKKTSICIREPSLGPYFGMKGGGTGAGRAQVVPAEAVNLHFTGDMYSVSKANNLLAAMVDNHLQHGNELRIDPRRVVLRRVIDLNDRALREIVVGLGGVKNGIPRKDGFNITPASEVMAILCLCRDYFHLGDLLGNMVVAFTYDGEPVYARDVQAVGAMQVLLRDAIDPNLVQTMEGTPAFVHGGPFANIAQGTNTAIATKMAMKLSQCVVTEAGFATDLGAEKFFDIKCRLADIKPSAVVIVATCRAVAYHGGFTPQTGLANLAKHIENIRLFGFDPVVAINRFDSDTQKELSAIVRFCGKKGVEAVVADHFSQGGKGAVGLGEAVLRSLTKNRRKKLRFLYPLTMPLDKKIETIAMQLYGADGVDFDRGTKSDLALFARHGYDTLPVCIAKTPLSLSDEPALRGRPKGFRIKVNSLSVSAGAGFVVAICGNIVTMPGLPKIPAAARIRILPNGKAVGLT
jgi:formate--tetrahydrofolate ligase